MKTRNNSTKIAMYTTETDKDSINLYFLPFNPRRSDYKEKSKSTAGLSQTE